MRPRSKLAPVLGALVLLPLTSCGGASDKAASAPMTEVTVPCDQFADTARKITDAQAKLYAGTGAPAAVTSLRHELDDLAKGAPADVKAAISEMLDAFGQAQQIMADPTRADTTKLAALGPRLSADSQKITAYVVSKCH